MAAVASLLLIHLAATLFMTGVIWFVQIVHYPLFNAVHNDYFRQHGQRTFYVVGPMMVVELATGLWLVWKVNTASLLWNAVLLAAIWISTFLLQTPQHTTLGRGFDQTAYRRLMRTNWVRTICWSIRSLILLLVVYQNSSFNAN